LLFAALAGALLVTTAVAVAGELRHAGLARRAAAPTTVAPSFWPSALGSLKGDAVVRERPDGGGARIPLAAGTPLEIGGIVSVGRFPLGRRLVWVRWQAGGVSGSGFAPASSVNVAVGTPVRLRLDALGFDAYGHPADGAPGSADAGSQAGRVGMSAAGGAGAIRIPWLPATVEPWRDELGAAALRYGVDPELLAIVVLVESGGNPAARSPSGAMGLMQVMPFHFGPGQDGYDTTTNIDVWARYLAQQLRAFGSADDPDWQRSVELAAAAYNGGPGSVQRWLGGGSLPGESASYRSWVGGMWRERHLSRSDTYERWLAAGGSRLVATAELAAVRSGS
jgi:hypothetical protein